MSLCWQTLACIPSDLDRIFCRKTLLAYLFAVHQNALPVATTVCITVSCECSKDARIAYHVVASTVKRELLRFRISDCEACTLPQTQLSVASFHSTFRHEACRCAKLIDS